MSAQLYLKGWTATSLHCAVSHARSLVVLPRVESCRSRGPFCSKARIADAMAGSRMRNWLLVWLARKQLSQRCCATQRVDWSQINIDEIIQCAFARRPIGWSCVRCSISSERRSSTGRSQATPSMLRVAKTPTSPFIPPYARVEQG